MEIGVFSSAREAGHTRTHWWWRDGWDADTRYLTWHVTLERCPGFHVQVEAYADALQQFPGLDVVPEEWRHLTLTGVGHRRDVSPAQLDSMIEAVRRGLASSRSGAVVRFPRLDIGVEGVMCGGDDAATTWLTRLCGDIDRISDDVLRGGEPMPGRGSRFWPHVSLAYANDTVEVDAIEAALRGVPDPGVTVTMETPTLTLMELRRDGHLYRWEPLAALPL